MTLPIATSRFARTVLYPNRSPIVGATARGHAQPAALEANGQPAIVSVSALRLDDGVLSLQCEDDVGVLPGD